MVRRHRVGLAGAPRRAVGVFTLLLALVALVAPVTTAPTAGAATTAGRWVLDRTVVDVVASPDNVTFATHTPGQIVRLTGAGWPGAASEAGWPIGRFTATYQPPASVLAPGTPVSIKVNVSGSLESTDRLGRVGITVVQLVNGVWNNVAVGTFGECGRDPSGAIACRQPAPSEATFVYNPTGTSFSIGIGVLNERAGITWHYRYEAAGRPSDTTVPEDTRAPSRRPVTTLSGIVKVAARYRPDVQPAELTTPALVTAPEGFRVQLAVRRGDRVNCAPSDQFRFALGGKVLAARRIDPYVGACQFELQLPEGVHRVQVTMAADDGTVGTGVVTVTVQDWLVFGLGDSNGAGEGAPVEGRWTDERCHRSRSSYQAMTAQTLENKDDLTSVTFVHLACSGASIAGGVLGGYAGLVPPDPPAAALPAQVDEMRRLAAGREVDAVVVSVGINDIGFGDLVSFCIEQPNCPKARGFVRSPKQTLEAFVAAFLAPDLKAKGDTLAKRYQSLAGALRRAGVRDDRVFVTQYFDPTRDAKGVTCNPLVAPITGGVFDRDEASWARVSVLNKLNQAIRAAAQKHGWRVVTGVAEGFARHGYCAGEQAWVRSLTGSLTGQGDRFGTLHATPAGNAFTSRLVTAAVAKSFYPKSATAPRAPRG